MAGSKFTPFSPGDVNLTALMNGTNAIYTGYNALTLTNMSTTAVPAIAAGSKIEDNGSLYQFSTEEPISTASVTSTDDGTWYIQLVPSSSVVTAQFSTTDPTWSDLKQGWYGTGGAANYRYIPISITKSSASYIKVGFKVDLATNSLQLNGVPFASLLSPSLVDVHGSRTMGTNYTNSLSYPVHVFARVNTITTSTGSNYGLVDAYINGHLVGQIGSPNIIGTIYGSFSLVVPSGSYYCIENDSYGAGSASVPTWWEMY